MKYLILILSLLLTGCATPRYLVDKTFCEKINENWDNCSGKGIYKIK